MNLSLKYYGNNILRKKCKKIEEITEDIKILAHNLIETMDKAEGIGLAANQVGYDICMFVMRSIEKEIDEEESFLGEAKIYINPVLSNPSRKTESMTEGCLSFPGIRTNVIRPYAINIEAIDLDGKKISCILEGLSARVAIHETDHLNGKYFIDRISKKESDMLKADLKKLKEETILSS